MVDRARALLRAWFWLAATLAVIVPLEMQAAQLPSPGEVQYRVETEKRSSLSQALADTKSWKSGDAKWPSTGFSARATWFRWKLPDPVTRRGVRMLRLDSGSARKIDAWILTQRGQVVRQLTMGAATKFDERPTRNADFIVPVVNKGSLIVVARFESVEPIQFSPILSAAADYRDAVQRAEISHSVIAGIALAMSLFGLLMFISLREKAYIAFVLWVPIMLMLQAHETGLAFRWLWPHKPELNDFAAVGLPALFAASTAFLTLTVLDLQNHPPIWLRVVFQVSASAGLALIASLSLIPWSTAIQMAWIVCVVVLVSSIGACMVRLFQRSKAALGYLTGMVMVTLAVLGHWATELAWLPPVGPANALLLGAGGFSIVAISVGLAQRLYSQERLEQFAHSSLMKSHKAATTRLEENVRARTFELEVANERLSRVNRIDGLTGVFNRRHFDTSLADGITRAVGKKQPLAVMMIDLDFFKKLNDVHGHAAGDACLIAAAHAARDCVSDTDGILARYGGEEFVALLTSTTPERAQKVAEEIRQRIEQAEIEYGGETIRMTASLGLHCAVPDSNNDPAAFLACADDALYQAKENGRNQVVVSGAITDISADTLSAESARIVQDVIADAENA